MERRGLEKIIIAVDMQKASTIDIPGASSLLDILSLIAPEKRAWWSSCRQDSVSVFFERSFRIRRMGEELDSDLLPQPDIMMSAIESRFFLKKVIIAGLPGYRGAYSGEFARRSFGGIILTPAEAGRLYEAVSGEPFEHVRYIEVHVGSLSVYRVRAPMDVRAGEIVGHL